ncbi:MAG: hypothetical protein QXK46_03760, partial [Candidatus Caldarchaeum sp.]
PLGSRGDVGWLSGFLFSAADCLILTARIAVQQHGASYFRPDLCSHTIPFTGLVQEKWTPAGRRYGLKSVLDDYSRVVGAGVFVQGR